MQRTVVDQAAAALASMYQGKTGSAAADEGLGALVVDAQPAGQPDEAVELADLRTWADELEDGEMHGLRGAGYNFNFTASFVLADAGSPAFNFGASVLPDSVTGNPTMTQTASGNVQVSAQVANLAGFSGIGTFVTVEGAYNVTNTTTNVNILYAPNLSNQSANTIIRSFIGSP